MRAVAAASGARWDAEHGVFVYRGDGALPAALGPFRAAPYSWEARVERELNGAATPRASVPTGNVALRPHQRAAVDAIRAARGAGRAGFLLADDVGLGKTITAWEAVSTAAGVTSVLIV
jgi:superfamily II DNA or RNA helicase